jgi:hypothetical protein
LVAEFISRLANGEHNSLQCEQGYSWVIGVAKVFCKESTEAPMEDSLPSIVHGLQHLKSSSTVLEYMKMWYMIQFKAKIDR